MEKILFDSHAHYDDKRFNEEIEGGQNKIISDVLSGDVKYILNAGTNIKTSLESLMLAEEYPQIYAAIGIHPHDTAQSKIKNDEETIYRLKRLLKREKAVAIGEIGLDFHYDFSEKDCQLKWFECQMQLAEEMDFPVIIHDREAHEQCMNIIRKYPKVTGILHSFSGSSEMARELIKLGYYISFSGVITFKNANRICEVVESVPIDRLLIETDCPYLAPHPNRGKINHSGYLKYTAETVAKIKKIDYNDICRLTCENACRIFGIK